MNYFILFFFGLAAGSFLNVVSMRYSKLQDRRIEKLKDNNRKNLSIFQSFNHLCGGRSHCPYCHKILKWYELIPLLSFIFQKGKCRDCGARLSLQYPLVEFLSGLIFVFVPYSILQSFNLSIFQSIIWIIIFLLFLLLSIIDFRHYIIPDSINLSLATLGVILTIFQSFNLSIFQSSFLGHYSLLFDFNFLTALNNLSIFQSFNLSILINHFFAAFIAMAFYAAIIILTRGRGMGWGDFKLIGAIGLIFGWPDALIISFLSFIIGSVFVLPLLVRGQKKMKDAVPFGPFIILAATAVFFFGFQLTDVYFKFFGLMVN